MTPRMRLHYIAITLVIAAPCMTAAQDSSADVAKIERAVAAYAKGLYPGKRLGLDLGVVPGVTENPPIAPYRTSQHIRDLASDAGANVVTLKNVVSCLAPKDPRSCSMRDFDAVLRIGVPKLNGDSATVWLYVRRASPMGLVPVSSSDKKLLAVRKSNAWQVIRVLQVRET